MVMYVSVLLAVSIWMVLAAHSATRTPALDETHGGVMADQHERPQSSGEMN